MRALLLVLVLVLVACSSPPIDTLPLPGAYMPHDASPSVPDGSDATPGAHCGLSAEWTLGSWGDCDGHPGCSYMCIAQTGPDGSRFRVAGCVIDGHVCVGQFVSDCSACP